MRLHGKNIVPPVPRHVFEDKTGKRLRFIVIWLTVICLVALALAAEFGYRVYHLAPPLLSSPVYAPYTVEQGQVAPSSNAISVVMKGSAYTDCGQDLLNFLPSPTGLAGYIPFNDPTALAGLRAHCADLDAVYFEAFNLSPLNGGVRALDPIGAAFPLAEFNTGFISRNRPVSYPVLTPEIGTTASMLEQSFEDPAWVAGFRMQIDRIDLTGVDGGFCLNLENQFDISAKTLIPIFTEINSWLEPVGLRSCLIGRVDAGFWQNPELVALVGRAVLLGFQSANVPTNPPSTQDWYDNSVNSVQSRIAPEKASFALGSFSRVWKSGRRSPEVISFSEAMLRANFYNGSVRYSADTGSTGASFIDDDRRLNQVWIQDAVSFQNKRISLDDNAQITVWPLGYEDAAIWALAELPSQSPGIEAALNAEIDLSDHVTIEGSGPFSTNIAKAVAGNRQVGISQTEGRVNSLSYTQIPSPQRIQFFGNNAELDLSISFKGLGSANQTDILLETLAVHDISATFFLSTIDLLLAESNVRKLLDAGHTIGAAIEPRESQSGVFSSYTIFRNNLTQQILRDQYNHFALLVENPSRYGSFPDDVAVLDQLQDLQTAGYLPVFGNLAAPYGDFAAEDFVQTVRNTAITTQDNVLRFVFSGNNAKSVNAALPEILFQLGQSGFTFTTLPTVAGLTSTQVFPFSNTGVAWRDQAIYWLMTVTWIGVQNFIFLLALIVALRSPIYLFLAFLRREKFPYDESFHPPVTIIIPAYNEAKVIHKTLESVCASDYPHLQVIVVDDGSRDGTAQVVAEAARFDDRVSLIKQTNHGKWYAEDEALKQIRTPIFAVVDADTLLHIDAIKYLVQPFKNDAVGAVAGTVEIGNRDNMITACQVIEYKISQNVMRRAYEVFNGILVVPGAIGAWRTDTVIESGQVSGDTITEDADLTVAIHRSDHKVVYAPNARSYTEAPNSVRSFMQQRLRWSFGMLQVAWKHRGSILEGRPVGFISILDAVWYRIVSSLVYPLVDLILIGTIISWVYGIVTQGAFGLADVSVDVLLVFFLLTVLDVINLAAAFWFERKFEWRLLLLVPFLRFGYRQLLYISSIRSIIHALSGQMRGWQKLERTDTATILEDHK